MSEQTQPPVTNLTCSRCSYGATMSGRAGSAAGDDRRRTLGRTASMRSVGSTVPMR